MWWACAGQRIAFVRVSPCLLADSMIKGSDVHWRVIEGVPDGATFIDSCYNSPQSFLLLFFEHESFDEWDGVGLPQEVVPIMQDVKAREWLDGLVRELVTGMIAGLALIPLIGAIGIMWEAMKRG